MEIFLYVLHEQCLFVFLHLQLTESGEKTMDVISVSQALQIAGRAGRFGTKWETGHVTTFKQEEIKVTYNFQSLKIVLSN